MAAHQAPLSLGFPRQEHWSGLPFPSPLRVDFNIFTFSHTSESIVTLPKAHLTSHSRMSGSRWAITPSWLSGSLRSFLHSSSVYSCHLSISSASVRSLPVFVLYCAYLCMKCLPWVSPIFFKRSLESSPFYCLPLFICIIHLRWLSDLFLLSSKTRIEMSVSFLFSFAFRFSFLSYL